MKKANMKEMACEERPYERCEQFGASNLTDSELLAVLLRTGTRGENALQLADKILHPVFSQKGVLNLHQWTYEQLMQIKGIGKVKAIQILCLAELSRRLAKATAQEGLNFSNPASIARYYMEDLRHANQEQMKLLLLNTKSRLIGETEALEGNREFSSDFTEGAVCGEALQKNAVSVVLLHSRHPSGDPTPSKEDVLITRRIQEAGRLIGVELLDHIVIGDNCYVSLREKGLVR